MTCTRQRCQADCGVAGLLHQACPLTSSVFLHCAARLQVAYPSFNPR